MDKYRKNFILCGDIDRYCLLCEELFLVTPDVERHIRWEKHRKNIKNQEYFPKFRKDCIYKIANNFYCEICNIATSDLPAVTEHIKSDNHNSMKANPQTEVKNFIGQYESGYIVIDKVIINMASWNSIVDKKCFLCNMAVEKNAEHMALKEHIINVIQSETIFENEKYYRKVKEDNYHCFTCKKIVPATTFNTHWENCTNIDEIELKQLKQAGSNTSIRTRTEDIAKMEELQKQLIGTLEDFFLIDDKNNISRCKYCNADVPIHFKAMIEHMKDQHNKPEPRPQLDEASGSRSDAAAASGAGTAEIDAELDNSEISSEEEVVYQEIIDAGKRRAELKAYGQKHGIRMNFNGSKGYCLVCDRFMSAHMRQFKEHLKGIVHKGHAELQGLKSPKVHVPSNVATKSILECTIEYVTEDGEFYVNYCSINVFSFFLLYQIEDKHYNKTKCFACNELLPKGKEREHCETPKHKESFLAAKYVTTYAEEDEFIREIRPNCFHCVYCNKTFPYTSTLVMHTGSTHHDFIKANKTVPVMATVAFDTSADDFYMKLIHYGFLNVKDELLKGK